MVNSLAAPSFKLLRKLGVNINKPILKKLLYKPFLTAQHRCQKRNDYEMMVDPFTQDKTITYCFKKCPITDFAKQFHLEGLMPAMCNDDCLALAMIHAKLIRAKNYSTGDICDFTILEEKNLDYINQHPEYVDDNGFIRNK